MKTALLVISAAIPSACAGAQRRTVLPFDNCPKSFRIVIDSAAKVKEDCVGPGMKKDSGQLMTGKDSVACCWSPDDLTIYADEEKPKCLTHELRHACGAHADPRADGYNWPTDYDDERERDRIETENRMRRLR